MVTAELRARIDRLWDAFWAAGISNSLEVVEQISHLVFVRYLEEFDSKRNDRVDREPVYTSETEHLRWSRVTNEDPDTMFALVRDALFPWLRDLRHEALTYSRYLESARFTIPTPGLLANVVDLVDEVPIGDPEVAGGMYEYVLDKVTTASRSPFTTPRHIVRLMVELAAPTPEDEICDPASGTAGFLVAAAEHIGGARSDARRFHGFEAAVKRLRLGSMNMLLHGHEDPDIRFRDSLAAGGGEGEAGRYSLILTRSPFGSTLEDDSVADDLRGIVETKKRELLFPALSSLLLEPGGRAAVIVPDGVLFGATKAHRELRRALIEEHRVEAVVKLPLGTSHQAAVSASILFFTKSGSGTDGVWFYEVTKRGGGFDGTSSDDGDFPDLLSRWPLRDGGERDRARTEQSFRVPKADIVAAGYDLSLGRYAERPRYRVVAGRVTLAHLHQAGLLAEGAQLVFEHAGTRHLARVKRGGWLELPDGQQFRFPTPAAVAAAGQGRFDGWQEWRSEDGTTLDRLRQRYLNDPVTGVASAAVLDVARTDERHRKLRAARERAMSGKPLALTVEELIGWWGRRGSLASEQVSSDLANYGLVTYPDFDAVPQHVTVELISERQYIDARRDVEGPSRGAQVQVVEESPTAAGEEVAPVVGMTVGRLRSALAGVVSVHPSASFEDAITKMVINDYSQLPVLANERQLRGAVTWKSIARARHANHAPSFSQAIGSARDVAYNQDLVDVLPILAEQDFVFVRDQTERIAGIVTASDLAAEYGATATPFFLIGELDQRLRRIIAATYDFAVVRALCDPEGARGIATFDDLSIGDYQRVLENKDCWDELAWPLNRKVFVERLDQLREIRNDLMHFNPGSRPDDDVQKIRNMINLLREYGG